MSLGLAKQGTSDLHYPPQTNQPTSEYQQEIQRSKKNPNQTINQLYSYLRVPFSNKVLFCFKRPKSSSKTNQINESADLSLFFKCTTLSLSLLASIPSQATSPKENALSFPLSSLAAHFGQNNLLSPLCALSFTLCNQLRNSQKNPLSSFALSANLLKNVLPRFLPPQNISTKRRQKPSLTAASLLPNNGRTLL